MKVPDPDLVAAFRATARCCEWCRKPGPIQVHHWWHRGLGDASRLDILINIMALCPQCHAEEENGQILRIDLLAVIAARENTTQDAIRREIWRLLRLPKGSKT